MLDLQLLRLAMRARLKTLVVCDTGVISLGADLNGYTRTAGSFMTEGYAPGMELAATGFVKASGNKVVTGVSDTNLYVDGGLTQTEAVAAGRRLVVGLPSQRFWEGRSTDQGVQPVQGVPYVEEELLPGVVNLRSLPQNGVVESFPTYVIRWYGVSDRGTRDLDTCVNKLLRLFPAAYGMPLSDGGKAWVRGDTAPTRTQPRPEKTGWSVVTVTFFLRALTINPAAT